MKKSLDIENNFEYFILNYLRLAYPKIHAFEKWKHDFISAIKYKRAQSIKNKDGNLKQKKN